MQIIRACLREAAALGASLADRDDVGDADAVVDAVGLRVGERVGDADAVVDAVGLRVGDDELVELGPTAM